jgi:hypothetical protein
MCGLLTNRILRRAGLHELGQHLAPWCCGSLIWLYSLPSEKVPAPPSPNWTFDRVEHALAPQPEGIHGALAHRLAALEDQRTKPHLRQHQPANSPQGPVPITTGAAPRSAGARQRTW